MGKGYGNGLGIVFYNAKSSKDGGQQVVGQWK